jgi:peptidoglycan hydrolase-like protein with peptidoglycan-binding domain
MTELMGETVTASLTTEPIEQAADTPGQALLRRVRAGRNKDFDRLVFDFDGPVPGVNVQYVPELTEDGSGDPIPLRGRAVVQIVMQPAVAHHEDGTPSVTGPPPDVTGFAAFRQVADAGDVDVVHAEPGTGNQLLRRGDVGAAVATWQWRLVQALDRQLAVDEDFGPVTEDATRDFQRAHGLTVDGIVGPASRAAMRRVLGL